MASHPTAQTGLFDISSHPSMACHQPAPTPNMELQSAMPVKRGPEDDVQFVSVHPVKKARGSRESPPAQIQQTPDQRNAHPQTQHDRGSQERGIHLRNMDAANGPPPESCMSRLGRGVSFSGLERYVFPPPPNSKPSQTTHNSPVLSPRQLPQFVLPNQIQNTMQTPQDLRGLLQPPPPQFQIPWGMSALYPQAAPMSPDEPMSRPMPLTTIQSQYISANPGMDIDDQPRSESIALRKPEPHETPQPDIQRMPPCGQLLEARVDSLRKAQEQGQDKTAQVVSSEAEYGTTKTLPSPSPRQEPQSQVQTLSHHPQIRPPTPIATQPEAQTAAHAAANNHNAMTGLEGPTTQQTPPPKGPCLICEQMRQQVLFNQANGLPVAHLPPMAHGWHGQGTVPPVPMGHPNPGFSMMPNMLHGLQQRFQTIPLGHLPMGYGMQPISYQQVQMQLQRQMPAPSMNGNESSQGVSVQDQPAQPIQGQQAPGQPPQYMHSQGPNLPQSFMIQRPIMMHQQAIAPPSSSPSPQPPSPQTVQATPAPTPTPAPAPAPIPARGPPALAPAKPKPKPKPKPKQHSPNLIVDIAETCEELFPWDEVAKRHGVTRVKVVDTFGAVIQLPLLRCTTDKKRHGKLATSRLREYTKAKKDTEATNTASAVKPTAAASTPPTSAAPVAQSQAAPVQAHQISVHQTENQQTRQAHAMHAQAIQAQAMQAQAMQAQANQMYAHQGHNNQNQLPPQPDHANAISQDRATLPGVYEMANTISPLGLPSNLTNGLSGHWQQLLN